jgi:hypothetical protein
VACPMILSHLYFPAAVCSFLIHIQSTTKPSHNLSSTTQPNFLSLSQLCLHTQNINFTMKVSILSHLSIRALVTAPYLPCVNFTASFSPLDGSFAPLFPPWHPAIPLHQTPHHITSLTFLPFPSRPSTMYRSSLDLQGFTSLRLPPLRHLQPRLFHPEHKHNARTHITARLSSGI